MEIVRVVETTGDTGRGTATTGETSGAESTLPRRILIAFAVGQLGWAILINLVNTWLIELYSGGLNPVTGATLVTAAVLSLIVGGGRLFDAVIDPLVAKFSDQAAFERGRRLPFMAVGALPSGIFAVLIFVPPNATATLLNAVWLVGMTLAFYIALTLYATPYFALIPELSESTSDRINLSTGVAIGFAIGLAISAQAAAIWGLVEASSSLSQTASIQVAIGILSGVAVLCMYAPVFAIDEEKHASPAPSAHGIVETLRKFSRNREFVSYVIADFAYFAGLSITQAAFPFYAVALLEIDRGFVGLFLGVIVLVWLALYPVVNVLAKRYGKKTLIRLAFLSLGVVFCFLGFLGLAPVDPVLQGLVASIASAVPMAFLGVLPNAVLGDIAKLDASETGDSQEGMFYAGRTLVQKIGQSTGLFVLPLLTILGDEPGDALGIRLTGVIGAVLCFVAFVAFRYYREEMVTEKLAGYEETTVGD
jgi:GPH family glycoside/pentoside/hexuronide:cation symporter